MEPGDEIPECNFRRHERKQLLKLAIRHRLSLRQFARAIYEKHMKTTEKKGFVNMKYLADVKVGFCASLCSVTLRDAVAKRFLHYVCIITAGQKRKRNRI